MPWNKQGDGGGPWGGGKGPWGDRGQPGDNGKDARGRDGGGDKRIGRGGGQLPPDLDALLQRLRSRWRNGFFKGAGGGAVIVGVVLVTAVLWLATGIYRVEPDEQGVVLRFGAYQETTQSGLHYHLPQPIETVLTPTVTRVRRTDIGFGADGEGSAMQLPEEALMLTGDENIVDINLSVFWTVKDARAYLFNIRSPDATVKSASESAIREIVGQNPIAPVLAEGRAAIESDTQKLLQAILDSYGAGILITQVQLQKADPPQPVIEAFRDVQRARTDMERLRNEAESYSNDVVPRARGDALRLTQEAEAYRSEVVARSQGDAQRFLQVYHAWANAKDITTERLYLETMEEVLKNSSKVILDRNASGSGVLPYLPLGDLARPRASRPSAAASSTLPNVPDTSSAVEAPQAAANASGSDDNGSGQSSNTGPVNNGLTGPSAQGVAP